MYGFYGRLLHIDLSCGKSSWLQLDKSRVRALLKEMIAGYFRARGLDEHGYVPEGKLCDLEVPMVLPGGESPCQAMKHAAC